MRLVLIISSLRLGGAERVLSTLANYWNECGHDVHLITIEDSDSDFYKINSGVKRHPLGLAGESKGLINGFIANIKRALAIRRTCLKIKPCVVLSFLDATNILVSIALLRSGIPLAVSERTDPTQINIGRARLFIRPFLYRYAVDVVVVQTDSVMKKVGALWCDVYLKSIPNPLSNIPKYSCNENNSRVMLSVGRLNAGKGFDVLIEAFALVAREYSEWTLRIAGEGELRSALQEKIDFLGLGSKIALCGSTSKVFYEYENAEIFCLASRYEGFPNSLLEALAMGCACISTDCESGPREILEDGRLGILTPVDDVSAMADAFRSLMGMPNYVRSMAHMLNTLENFTALIKVSQQWLDLFVEVQK